MPAHGFVTSVIDVVVAYGIQRIFFSSHKFLLYEAFSQKWHQNAKRVWEWDIVVILIHHKKTLWQAMTNEYVRNCEIKIDDPLDEFLLKSCYSAHHRSLSSSRLPLHFSKISLLCFNLKFTRNARELKISCSCQLQNMPVIKFHSFFSVEWREMEIIWKISRKAVISRMVERTQITRWIHVHQKNYF
jgi:hypothetical protein